MSEGTPEQHEPVSDDRAPSLQIEPPYVGPRSFESGQTLFGRTREVRELLYLLIAERIVLLVSPSGAGKTSLIQAGLIPELQRKHFQVLPQIRVHQNLPDGVPVGMQVVGLPYQDALLLQIGLDYQSGTDHHRAMPPGLDDAMEPYRPPVVPDGGPQPAYVPPRNPFEASVNHDPASPSDRGSRSRPR